MGRLCQDQNILQGRLSKHASITNGVCMQHRICWPGIGSWGLCVPKHGRVKFFGFFSIQCPRCWSLFHRFTTRTRHVKRIILSRWGQVCTFVCDSLYQGIQSSGHSIYLFSCIIGRRSLFHHSAGRHMLHYSELLGSMAAFPCNCLVTFLAVAWWLCVRIWLGRKNHCNTCCFYVW